MAQFILNCANPEVVSKGRRRGGVLGRGETGEDSDRLPAMADRDPPKKKLEQRPGENVWEAMARELTSNPDSPAPLHIMSAVGKAVKPRNEAVEQVVAALEAQRYYRVATVL